MQQWNAWDWYLKDCISERKTKVMLLWMKERTNRIWWITCPLYFKFVLWCSKVTIVKATCENNYIYPAYSKIAYYIRFNRVKVRDNSRIPSDMLQLSVLSWRNACSTMQNFLCWIPEQPKNTVAFSTSRISGSFRNFRY